MRHSLNFCAWKDRKAVAVDLRAIYGAVTADQAAAQLGAFEKNGPRNTLLSPRPGGGHGKK